MAAPKDTQLGEKNQTPNKPVNPADGSTGNLIAANGSLPAAGVPTTGPDGKPALDVSGADGLAQDLTPGINRVDGTSVDATEGRAPSEGESKVSKDGPKVGDSATVTNIVNSPLHDFESGEVYEFDQPVEGVELTSFLIGQFNAGRVRLEQ